MRVYPAGEAKAASDYGADFGTDMNFGKIAEAAGAHGEFLSEPDGRRRRDRALPRGRALRPLGGAACQGDEDLDGLSSRAQRGTFAATVKGPSLRSG